MYIIIFYDILLQYHMQEQQGFWSVWTLLDK